MKSPDFSHEDYLQAAAWPFEEAKRVLERLKLRPKAVGANGVPEPVLVETGYGPSGLPHIGTFAEVFRTTLVKQAFERLMPGVPTRLLCFSDDLDGMRKIPANIPNFEMLKLHVNKPLSRLPDPFGQYESFAHHNNAMLRRFLDSFGFMYEFASSSEVYASGRFNATLLKVLSAHAEICGIIVPTLGEERAASYSPFLPICPDTGHVLQVPVVATDAAKGTIVYRREDGKEVETPVTDGRCKLQWKADWAMRWAALGVDYEMSGKDLIDSVQLGSRICRAIGGEPPVSLTYEHFVDEHGAKISKSKGNGLTIEEWLKYAPPSSLSLYMFRTPTRAKKLYRSLIPTVVEEYAEMLEKYPALSVAEKLESPVFYLHNGEVPANPLPFRYDMLLNLVSVTAAEKPDVVWNYLMRYRPDLNPENAPQLADLIQGAIRFYADTIKPTQHYVGAVSDVEQQALEQIAAFLRTLSGGEDAEMIQTEFYEIGKRTFGKEQLRGFFKFLYQSLLGFENGPRLGTFTTIYGHKEMLGLVVRAQGR